MKIHIALQNPLQTALVQVLNLIDGQEFVDFLSAKLVIVEDKSALIKLHSLDKYFIVFSVKNPGVLPANAEWINLLGGIVTRLMPLIADPKEIENRIAKATSHVGVPSTRDPIESVTKVRGFGPEVNILVVDDREKNRERAKTELASQYNLTIASTYIEAMEVLNWDEHYEYVLSDLYLPPNDKNKTLSPEAIEIGAQIPYGFLIALEAARKGSHVAIVTDANHHQDCLSAELDSLRKGYLVNGKKLMLINYCGKNWAEALQILKGEQKEPN
ncbi:MAG: hypothetical protein G01um101418_156 [Parcubacteria group bacterium Gr01-1014_18]|nr:MAG: hypothetical protein Greene041636_461 [Parcubacteria group bacterium Greene0416_36]TSC81483.1 MAG: hypothetical protein G01um101418_156 [Parcubacteria group bacterium Gr01-1014_18]TSC99081.1 MAG: hypothetical protein Greene101420_437 [Parcubacteria group bacterium Greene1014_20]TSD07239.1 MAG: hypothetical protein Greene07142_255 [Parcubacteria group bacterium Greene0714_2]